MIAAKRLGLLFHTVKYLRWEQVWFRIYYRIRKNLNVSKVKDGLGVNSFGWDGNLYLEQSISGCEANFHGEKGQINFPEDWNTPSKSKLWLYNLHYFDDLNACPIEVSRTKEQSHWIDRWINENPIGQGNGWEPYPISLRLVNWVKWCARNQIVDQSMIQSIYQQSEVLMNQLEYHILGNHLFANAKALVFVGAYLDCERSSRYLDKGISLINREVQEQFLDDGGHFERSPMYHSILLWDLLDIICLAKESNSYALLAHLDSWVLKVQNAIRWFGVMCHPDGEISFFNDAAFKIAPPLSAILEYSEKLGVQVGVDLREVNNQPLIELQDSGYSRINMPLHSVLFDHAPVGPDYLPGHGHADTLSFEWYVGGQRVIVNSGTSQYGVGEERLRQRKTESHSTVVINGMDSSEVWGGFRVARRAYARLINTKCEAGEVIVKASHDGYERLDAGLIHHRKIRSKNECLKITDSITGSLDSAKAYFHLHPEVTVIFDDSEVCLILDNGLRIRVTSSDKIMVENSTWHPEFGESVASKKFVIDFTSPECTTTFLLLEGQ